MNFGHNEHINKLMCSTLDQRNPSWHSSKSLCNGPCHHRQYSLSWVRPCMSLSLKWYTFGYDLGRSVTATRPINQHLLHQHHVNPIVRIRVTTQQPNRFATPTSSCFQSNSTPRFGSTTWSGSPASWVAHTQLMRMDCGSGSLGSRGRFPVATFQHKHLKDRYTRRFCCGGFLECARAQAQAGFGRLWSSTSWNLSLHNFYRFFQDLTGCKLVAIHLDRPISSKKNFKCRLISSSL